MSVSQLAVCLNFGKELHIVYVTGIPTTSKSTADFANFHGTLVDHTGVHGQVHAC